MTWSCNGCGYKYSACMGDDEVPEICRCGGKVMKNEIAVKCKKHGFTLLNDDVKYFFDYLDDLRDGGYINMYGAPQALMDDFEMCFKEASWVVGLWMHWVQHGELKDEVAA